MNITTKTGDGGFTRTLNQQMVHKRHPDLELIGEMDELSVRLGSALSTCRHYKTATDLARLLQSHLQAHMGLISGGLVNPMGIQSLLEKDLNTLDQACAERSAHSRFEGFVFPGGYESVSSWDLVRTQARKVERILASCSTTNAAFEKFMPYYNRLSDLAYLEAKMRDWVEKTIDRQVTQVTQGNPVKQGADRMAQWEFCENVPVLNLSMAEHLSQRVIEKAVQIRCAVTVVISGSDGQPLVLKRMDGAMPGSGKVAINKAYTSALFLLPSEALSAFKGIENQHEGQLITLKGGQPLFYKKRLLGAVGVSGASETEDLQLAIAAAEEMERIECR